jgi:multidrug efflux pump subunit AcrB
MIDLINRMRANGSSVFEAVMQSGTRRFRAIMLTTLTTFLGLTPLLLEKSIQAKFLIPMAISVAFGVVFATIITLLIVPSLYMIVEDLRQIPPKISRQKSR